MNLLNWLTLASFTALNIDILLQVSKIRSTKSSRDISIAGLSVRLIAATIIAIKYLQVGDNSLLLGQIFILISLGTYFAYAVLYKKRQRTKR